MSKVSETTDNYLQHEPWCTDHDDETMWGPTGQCGHGHDFGPIVEHSPTGMPAGRIAAHRASSDDADMWGTDVKVYLDYRTMFGGYMDTAALRALHEALQEDPAGLTANVGRLVTELGRAVPARHGAEGAA